MSGDTGQFKVRKAYLHVPWHEAGNARLARCIESTTRGAALRMKAFLLLTITNSKSIVYLNKMGTDVGWALLYRGAPLSISDKESRQRI
jgi:hypothetical protein